MPSTMPNLINFCISVRWRARARSQLAVLAAALGLLSLASISRGADKFERVGVRAQTPAPGSPSAAAAR